MFNIIGGGPVGLMAAYELAKRGYRAIVYEEHKKIGEPLQCTGIVTRDFLKISTQDVVINKLKSVRVVSKNISIKLPAKDLVIDRTRLDRNLAEKAESEGTMIKRSHRLEQIPKGPLIGADGPNSMVRRHINPNLKVHYYVGKQATVRGHFNPEVYEVHLGNVAPGFFAWIVPENEHLARIGVATMTKVDEYFQRFIRGRKIVAQQAGLIPIYDRHVITQKNNISIVGDAALQVKATTGGGLVQGLTAARILAKNPGEYEKAWRQKLGRELFMHLEIRKTLNIFKDRDYDRLVQLLNSPNIRRIFKKNHRDSAVSLALSLLKEPSLLAFGAWSLARRHVRLP